MNNIETLIERLKVTLKSKSETFVKMSESCTGNCTSDTLEDLGVSFSFLDTFNIKKIPKNIKPKGKIFVILSFNEPLLLSLVPIVSALAVGNEVYVKPSSKNYDLFTEIWSELIIELSLPMHIVRVPVDQIEDYIQKVNAVYFFGSYKNAKCVYSLCAKHFVEFFPEVETADCKIYNQSRQNEMDVMSDIKVTIENSFTHSGMVCQRISGVFVNKDNYTSYIEKLIEYAEENDFCLDTLSEPHSVIEKDIFDSMAEIILKRDDDYIVVNPDVNSAFTKNAYFGKVIWISAFSDSEWLINYLNERKFFLGVNIISDDTEFTDKIIAHTKFSRYTLRNNHCSVLHDTGWGGNWPTGSGGYKSWYEAFSNKYTILN